jgi:hypothetical protein
MDYKTKVLLIFIVIGLIAIIAQLITNKIERNDWKD